MHSVPKQETPSVYIDGPRLRERWGGMATSTFYNRMQRGLIPKPEHPFGPDKPYWRMEVIEAHERQAQPALEAA